MRARRRRCFRGRCDGVCLYRVCADLIGLFFSVAMSLSVFTALPQRRAQRNDDAVWVCLKALAQCQRGQVERL